jgi:shikimate kinase
MIREEIILIGPMGTGKSTLGRLLSQHLKLPQCSMDDLRWAYYEEIGFTKEKQEQIAQSEGFEGVARYWKPFEAHAVERLLAEHRDCVIDFGAGHSVYEDDALFERVRRALLPFRNVVLILPSPDLDESVRILRTRTYSPKPGEFDFNALFVRHHSNHDLAKIVVYNHGKTPKETRDEILASIAARQ